MELYEAIVESARRRLRPILMTTGTTVLALIPVALGSETGGETQAPLARVVAGGLTSSTLITLFVVPVLYVLLERSRIWLTRRLGGRVLEAPATPPDASPST
jgi:HAE1 family hydrophobic/amphiphilic exporter-1